MKIAFLGLGQMGRAIAQLLIENGEEVTVWNRTAATAGPLVERGAKLAKTAARAVQAADTVFTMLFDDHAVEDVLFNQGVLTSIPVGAIHISLSTISVALAERLEQEHAARHQRFLSAPVFGRPDVAAEGKLWLVLAAAEEVIASAMPLLKMFSRGHTIVGTVPGQASAAKLAGNFLIASTVASLAEAYTVTESLGIDPATFLEAANSALYQSPFFANYGRLMLDPPAKPGATIQLGVKDTQLFRKIGQAAQTSTPLADLLHHRLEAAFAAGRGEEDWASGYLAQTRAQTRLQTRA